MSSVDSRFRAGLIFAVAAHCLWGLFPLYWRLLDVVPSIQLVCHRILWSFVLLLIVVPAMLRFGRWEGLRPFLAAVRCGRTWAVYAVAAAMIGINWAAFLWAVNHDRVLDASLGYYINPLLNVLLGVVFLRERLRVAQWLAVGIAATGVSVITVAGGGLPVASLAMAFSFAFYGLVKKKAPLPTLVGLMLETTVLAMPAIGYLAFAEIRGAGAFGHSGGLTDLLLITGGLVTVTPLALFATACQRVPLSTIGLLQYVGPTLQFFVGTLVFGEPFGGSRLIGFGFVWCGLIIYLFSRERPRPEPLADATGDEEAIDGGRSRDAAVPQRPRKAIAASQS